MPDVLFNTLLSLVIIFAVLTLFIVSLGWAVGGFKSTNSRKTASKPNIIVTQTPSQEDVEKSLLEFDAKTWEDFKLLYISHNNFVKNIDAFSDFQMGTLDFYNCCKEAEEYFQNAALSFDYGTTDDEKTYLSSFEIAALADQEAAQKLMKYIDSGKTSYLSDTNEQIQRAKEAFVMIASNRGKLLVRAGLTNEEIAEKVEEDMAALDEEGSK